MNEKKNRSKISCSRFGCLGMLAMEDLVDLLVPDRMTIPTGGGMSHFLRPKPSFNFWASSPDEPKQVKNDFKSALSQIFTLMTS